MWFRNRDVNNVEKNGFRHPQCVVSKQHVGLYVESKQTNEESKLLLQLLLCRFDICLFLLDRRAKIDPTELSTCRGSFGGFDSTCFQLDRAARIKTTRTSYFSCDRSPLESALCCFFQEFVHQICWAFWWFRRKKNTKPILREIRY
jgi:hypothetical protein